jgi:hypothetical protein
MNFKELEKKSLDGCNRRGEMTDDECPMTKEAPSTKLKLRSTALAFVIRIFFIIRYWPFVISAPLPITRHPALLCYQAPCVRNGSTRSPACVVKLGTGILTDSRKQPDLPQLEQLVTQIAEAAEIRQGNRGRFVGCRWRGNGKAGF